MKERLRKLRELAAAATTEAQAGWDVLVSARAALGEAEPPEGKSITDTAEFASAKAAQEAYEASAEAARKADTDYKAVLELMGTEGRPDTSPLAAMRSPKLPAEEPAQSMGAQFVRKRGLPRRRRAHPRHAGQQGRHRRHRLRLRRHARAGPRRPAAPAGRDLLDAPRHHPSTAVAGHPRSAAPAAAHGARPHHHGDHRLDRREVDPREGLHQRCRRGRRVDAGQEERQARERPRARARVLRGDHGGPLDPGLQAVAAGTSRACRASSTPSSSGACAAASPGRSSLATASARTCSASATRRASATSTGPPPAP